MGTWAAGNFDSDAAMDELGDILDHLAGRVNELLEEVAIDEGFDEAMANIDAIRLLSETFGGAPPKPADIKKWRQKLVKVYDREIDGMDPDPGYKKGRRMAIEGTFDKLLSHAEKFWKK